MYKLMVTVDTVTVFIHVQLIPYCALIKFSHSTIYLVAEYENLMVPVQNLRPI